MLSLHCPFCNAPTRHRTTEHATYVFDGMPVCARDGCRARAVGVIQAEAKCVELGLPFEKTLYFAGAP